jgi:predicted restriction endonuclease
MDTDYPSDWESRRKKVYERDDHKCQNCGRGGGEHGNVELHAHHIVPKSKGGTHKKSNLISVCKQCHNAIHNDSNAPTTGAQTDLREFKNLLDRTMKIMKYIDEGVTVRSPGELQNQKFERDRISVHHKAG